MMSPIEFVNSDFCQRLTLTLLHMLWLGAVIAIVAVTMGQCFKRASARARYLVNVAALLSMLVCLPMTFALVAVEHVEESGSVDVASGIQMLTIDDLSAMLASRSDADAVEISELVTSVLRKPSPLQTIAPYATAVYLAGLAILLTRLVILFRATGRMRRNLAPVEDREILEMLGQQARKIGLPRVPAITWCNRVAVPSIVGIVRPIILLPASLATGLGPEQIQAIVIHELAHIRRHDPLVHLLQRFTESLLFFHPLVWFISRQVSLERENCCDDAVVASGWKPVDYANALVRMAELCAANGSGPIASRATMLAATGNAPSQFKRRVLRLLGSSEEPNLRLTRPASLAVLVVAAAVLLVPALQPAPETIGDDVQPAIADSKQSATKLEPGESIYNDKLRRFKFRLENIPVVGEETVQYFMNYYYRDKNPKIIGALADPLTDSLIVIGPPEAEQAIRTCLAKWQVELSGIYPSPTSLDLQAKGLDRARKRLIEEITAMELAAVEVADDNEKLLKVKKVIAAFQVELDIVERQIAVVEKNRAWLKSDPLRSTANMSNRPPRTIGRPAWPRTPDVKGLVLTESNEKLKQVEISIGSDDGLRNGDLLFVWRDGACLATLVVKHLMPDRAIARIVTDIQKPLRKGDNVTSRIEPDFKWTDSPKSDNGK